MSEHTQPHQEIADLATLASAVYGMRGMTATTESSDNGSYCIAEPTGIRINIDPQQIADKTTGDVSEERALVVSLHEVGHAIDMIASPEDVLAKRSPTDHFFYCLADDVVIDSRLCRLPGIKQDVMDLYGDVMPEAKKIAEMPLSAQLMWGIRIGEVTGESLELHPEVNGIIDNLKNYTTKTGDKFDIIETLTDPRTDLINRRNIANRYIKPAYDKLVEQDKESGQGERLEEIIEEYTEEQIEVRQVDKLPGGPKTEAGRLEGLGKRILKIFDGKEDEKDTSEKTEDTEPVDTVDTKKTEDGLSREQFNELAEKIAKEMGLLPGDAEAYTRASLQHAHIIKSIAEVLKTLTKPAFLNHRLTYGRKPTNDGPILHSTAVTGLVTQKLTGDQQAVWRSITRSDKTEKLTFSGLDIHLLVDVSGSMGSGNKAQSAATTALCLLEGLQLARAQVAKDTGVSNPDVRTHIVAFGSDALELSAVSYQPTPAEKGATFTNLSNPTSSATFVNDALLSCGGPADSGRDNIILIITDGDFHDHYQAQATVNSFPKNTYVGQFNIGGYRSVTPNMRTMSDPSVLPVALLEVLANYTGRYI